MSRSSSLPDLYLISAGIAGLTCFCRPDYNLPVMVFAYLTFKSDFKKDVFFYCFSITYVFYLVKSSSLAFNHLRHINWYRLDVNLGVILEKWRILSERILGEFNSLFCTYFKYGKFFIKSMIFGTKLFIF